MTKKAAALLLAASLAVSVCAMPVFAAEMGSQEVDTTTTTGVGTGQTTVYYKVTESYQWSVPITIDFGENAGVNNTSTVEATLGGSTAKGEQAKNDGNNKWKGTAPKIMVTKNVIGVGKELQITFDTNYLDQDNDKFYVETPEITKPGTQPTKYEKLYFKVQKNDASKTELTKDNNVVLSVPSGTNTAEQELVFTLETASDTAEKAGDYVGYVVFHSHLVVV